MAVILCPLIRQVWLRGSAIRLATCWLLGEWSEPFLAAKRHISLWSGRPQATKSRERGWIVSLAGFWFAFRAKNGEWHDSHMGFQVSFASPWLQWRNVLIPLRPNLLSVYVYLHHWRSKFVYCVRKLFLTVILGESWRPQAARKQQKLVSHSSQHWERRSPVTVF